MTDISNMEGYLLKIDIEKAFDLVVDNYFLIGVVEKYGFEKKFLRWIETKFEQSGFLYNLWKNYNSYFKLK